MAKYFFEGKLQLIKRRNGNILAIIRLFMGIDLKIRIIIFYGDINASLNSNTKQNLAFSSII